MSRHSARYSLRSQNTDEQCGVVASQSPASFSSSSKNTNDEHDKYASSKDLPNSFSSDTTIISDAGFLSPNMLHKFKNMTTRTPTGKYDTRLSRRANTKYISSDTDDTHISSAAKSYSSRINDSSSKTSQKQLDVFHDEDAMLSSTSSKILRKRLPKRNLFNTHLSGDARKQMTDALHQGEARSSLDTVTSGQTACLTPDAPFNQHRSSEPAIKKALGSVMKLNNRHALIVEHAVADSAVKLPSLRGSTSAKFDQRHKPRPDVLKHRESYLLTEEPEGGQKQNNMMSTTKKCAEDSLSNSSESHAFTTGSSLLPAERGLVSPISSHLAVTPIKQLTPIVDLNSVFMETNRSSNSENQTTAKPASQADSGQQGTHNPHADDSMIPTDPKYHFQVWEDDTLNQNDCVHTVTKEVLTVSKPDGKENIGTGSNNSSTRNSVIRSSVNRKALQEINVQILSEYNDLHGKAFEVDQTFCKPNANSASKCFDLGRTNSLNSSNIQNPPLVAYTMHDTTSAQQPKRFKLSTSKNLFKLALPSLSSLAHSPSTPTKLPETLHPSRERLSHSQVAGKLCSKRLLFSGSIAPQAARPRLESSLMKQQEEAMAEAISFPHKKADNRNDDHIYLDDSVTSVHQKAMILSQTEDYSPKRSDNKARNGEELGVSTPSAFKTVGKSDSEDETCQWHSPVTPVVSFQAPPDIIPHLKNYQDDDFAMKLMKTATSIRDPSCQLGYESMEQQELMKLRPRPTRAPNMFGFKSSTSMAILAIRSKNKKRQRSQW